MRVLEVLLLCGVAAAQGALGRMSNREWVRTEAEKLIECAQMSVVWPPAAAPSARAGGGAGVGGGALNLTTTFWQPDCSNGYNGMFTRDFYYTFSWGKSLLNGTTELGKVRQGIDVLRTHQRSDGVPPGVVYFDNSVVFTPWDWSTKNTLDDAAYYALLVAEFTLTSGDLAWFCGGAGESALRALRSLPRRDGAVWNDPRMPQVCYGFRDTAVFTEHVLFTSLVVYEAATALGQAAAQAAAAGACPNVHAAELKAMAAGVAKALPLFDDPTAPLLVAATGQNRRADIWGSMKAIQLRLVDQNRSRALVDQLLARQSRAFYNGLVNSVLDDNWFPLFANVAPGDYQNGGYWGTPHQWVLPAIARFYPEKARAILDDAIAYYRTRGNTNEWVRKDDPSKHGVFLYVASGMSAYAADQQLGAGTRR